MGVMGPSSPFSEDEHEWLAVGEEDIHDPCRHEVPMLGVGEAKLKCRPERMGSTKLVYLCPGLLYHSLTMTEAEW
jgi:hypothetical protein